MARMNDKKQLASSLETGEKKTGEKVKDKRRYTVGFDVPGAPAAAGSRRSDAAATIPRVAMPTSMSMQEIGDRQHGLLSALKRPSVISWLDNAGLDVALMRNDFASAWGFRMKRVDNFFTVVGVQVGGPASGLLQKGDKIISLNGSDATLIADADAEHILKFSGLQLELRILREFNLSEHKRTGWLGKMAAKFKIFK